MTDYDIAIADMEARLEELKQAREAEKVPLLPDVPGFYHSTFGIYLLDYEGDWSYGAADGVIRDFRSVEHMQLAHARQPLARQKLVDA